SITSILLLFFSSFGDYPVLHSFLHDALPICFGKRQGLGCGSERAGQHGPLGMGGAHSGMFPEEGFQLGNQALAEGDQGFIVGKRDRKSTRLNSSHSQISYAVFCLKKKKKKTK